MAYESPLTIADVVRDISAIIFRKWIIPMIIF